MTAILTSQVTQLLYRVTPILNFAQIVGDLRHRFGSRLDVPCTLTWDCDDIALLDFGAARVVIGFSDGLPGPHTACMTAAVGQSPLPNTPRLTSADQFLLSEAVSLLLVKRVPCDEQRSQAWVHPHSLTADLIDQFVDTLFHEAGHPTRPTPVVCGSALSGEGTPIVGVPNDMERLIQRLSSELTSRSSNVISRAIASAIPTGRKASAKEHSFSPLHHLTSDGNAPQTPSKNQTAKCGLFWQKGAKLPQVEGQEPARSSRPEQKTGSASDLKAVREALYAGDKARTHSSKGLSAQTRMALNSLSSLSIGLVAALVEKQRESSLIGSRIKH